MITLAIAGIAAGVYLLILAVLLRPENTLTFVIFTVPAIMIGLALAVINGTNIYLALSGVLK